MDGSTDVPTHGKPLGTPGPPSQGRGAPSGVSGWDVDGWGAHRAAVPPPPTAPPPAPLAADGAFFDIDAPSPGCIFDPLRAPATPVSGGLEELLGAWALPADADAPQYHSATAFVPSPLSALRSPAFASPGAMPGGWISFGSSGGGDPGCGAQPAASATPPAQAQAAAVVTPQAAAAVAKPSLVDDLLARSLQGLGSR